MHKMLMCFLAGGIAEVAFAAVEFTWNGGENGAWNDPLSYVGGVAGGNLPGADDEVWIPKDTTVNINVTNAESFKIFANVKRIRPESDTSVLVFDIPAGVTSVVNSAFNKDSWAGANTGLIVKRGEGVLKLESFANFRNNGNDNGRDNYVNYTIESGTVIFPQNVTHNNYRGYYGRCEIAEGATLVTEGGTSVRTYIYGIVGGGTITNYSSSTKILGCSGTGGEFSGRITYPLKWYSSGRVMLTGTDSTMAGDFQHMDLHKFTAQPDPLLRTSGVVGLAKIGRKGEPSSCGITENIVFREKSAALIYLGEGETTDRNLVIWDTASGPAYLDGGAHGGLHWSGNWSAAAGGNKENHHIVLTGSNTSECVFFGGLSVWESGGNVYDFAVTKQGIGTWHFADSADNASMRTFGGPISVENGVFRFDSLAETGTVCSVGTAVNPFICGGVSAFSLGSANAGCEAVLEYAGTNVRPVSAACATQRRISLNGRGTVRANGRWMGLSGVQGASAGNHVLVLDGTGVNHNVMSDISDGLGKVSVEKRGSGTWAIGRDLTFSGSLDVKEGTLLVRPADRYTWFRWTIQENQSTSTNGSENIVAVQELGFFDGQGIRQNLGLATNGNVHAIGCGEVALDTCYGYKMTPDSGGALREIHCLFDNKNTDPGWMVSLSSKIGSAEGGYRPRISKPDSWLPVVVRLPKNANKIVKWDWAYPYKLSRTTTVGRNVGRYVLDASVDGLNWDRLSTHHEGVVPEFRDVDHSWRFSGEKHEEASSTVEYSGGEAIRGVPLQTYSTLDNVKSVSIAAGASLVADGDPISLPAGVTLAVYAGGNGNLEGFVLPSTGTVDILGWDGESGFASLDFSGTTGWSNIDGWTVTVGGTATSRLKVKASADGLSLVKTGMTIVVR